jgi:hypothetical protein
MLLRGTKFIMAALRLYRYETEYDQLQQQTSIPYLNNLYQQMHGECNVKFSIPYSEGPILHILKIFMHLNQIRSNLISNQTLSTRCFGSGRIMVPQN